MTRIILQFYHLSFICILGILFLFCGCQKQTAEDKLQIEQHAFLKSAIYILSEKHQEKDFFSANQLEALLGQPDKIIIASEYGTIVPANNNYMQEDVKNIIEDMEDSLIHYSKSAYIHASEVKRLTLNKCDLWVYNWHKPVPEYALIAGSFHAEAVYPEYSYAYLLYDSTVISCLKIRHYQLNDETKK